MKLIAEVSSSLSTSIYPSLLYQMGYSYGQDDGPRMCFNAAKMYQLGWYTSNTLELNPLQLSSPLNVALMGAVDYDVSDSSRVVLIKLNQASRSSDFYLTFNSKTGFNSGTVDGGNRVIVNIQGGEGNSYATSDLIDRLGAGNALTLKNFNGESGKDVVITVNSIDLTARIAHITISLPGDLPTPAPTPIDVCNAVEPNCSNTDISSPSCCATAIKRCGKGKFKQNVQVCTGHRNDAPTPDPFETQSPLCWGAGTECRGSSCQKCCNGASGGKFKTCL